MYYKVIKQSNLRSWYFTTLLAALASIGKTLGQIKPRHKYSDGGDGVYHIFCGQELEYTILRTHESPIHAHAIMLD